MSFAARRLAFTVFGGIVLGAGGVGAQVKPKVEPPIEKPAEKPAAAAPALTPEQVAANKAAAEKAKKAAAEKKLLAAHRKLKIKRSERDILQGIADRAAKDHDGTPAIERLRLYVVAGDWSATGTYLAKLPKAIGPAVYDHVLNAMLADKTGVMLTSDILPLAAACPGKLEPHLLDKLGQLLARAGRVSGRPTHLLGRLENGVGEFGGEDPEDRLRAGRLLLGAKMLEAAFPFLPALPETIQPHDFELANVHASYYELESRKKPESLDKAWDLSVRVTFTPRQKPPVKKPAKKPALPETGPDGKPVPAAKPDPAAVALAAKKAADQKKRLAKIEKERKDALARVVRLLPRVEEVQSRDFLTECFGKRPIVSANLVAEVGRQSTAAQMSPNPKTRVQSLEGLHLIVDRILSKDSIGLPQRHALLSLLVLSWTHESYLTLGVTPKVENAAAGTPDGNIQAAFNLRRAARAKKRVAALPAEDLLRLAPKEEWRARIEPDLVPRLHRLNSLLVVKAEQYEDACKMIEEEDIELAREMAHSMIRWWSEKQPAAGRYGSRYDYFSSGTFYYYNDNVPTTRAKQARNIAALGKMVKMLNDVFVEPLNAHVLANAFARCHSPAEVYREEDIETVFGGAGEIPAGAVIRIVADMRGKLAKQWRSKEVQTAAKTKRKKKQIAQEVMRGYQLAERMLTQAVDATIDNEQLWMYLGGYRFDRAEFAYGQKVELEEYIELREQSFEAFERAAEVYADKVATLDPEKDRGKFSAEVYRQWFQVALGASDLAFLTRQDKPDLDQIEKIHGALRALPADSVDLHLTKFGQALDNASSSLPPRLKPRYFKHGLRVLDDHEGGKKAREMMQLYAEMAEEVKLEFLIDGSSEVGHGRPFGVHMVLRYSTSVGRETDGFARYLRNKVSLGYSNTPVDYRDDLEKKVREALEERFDIVSLAFHDPKIEMREYGQDFWRETPLAYLVMQAKDPSVDRMPPVRMDLDFPDGRGYVILPIESREVLLNAREVAPAPRRVRDLAVHYTLDDRKLAAEGKVQLECRFTGKGVLPPQDVLLDPDTVPGYAVAEVQDDGLLIKSMEVEDAVEPLTEQTYTIVYEPKQGDLRAAEFAFPEPLVREIKVERSRYSDADVVKAEPVVAIPGIVDWQQGPWPAILGTLMFIVLALALFFVARRQVRTEPEPFAYSHDPDAGPFATIALLKRMANDPQLRFGPEDRTELDRVVAGLEARYFGKAPKDAPEPFDLGELGSGWVQRAQRVRAS